MKTKEEENLARIENLNKIRDIQAIKVESIHFNSFLASIVHSIEIFLLFFFRLHQVSFFLTLSDFHEHQPKSKQKTKKATAKTQKESERRTKKLKMTVNCSRFRF